MFSVIVAATYCFTPMGASTYVMHSCCDLFSVTLQNLIHVMLDAMVG
jgi:hypothetical protein